METEKMPAGMSNFIPERLRKGDIDPITGEILERDPPESFRQKPWESRNEYEG